MLSANNLCSAEADIGVDAADKPSQHAVGSVARKP